MNIYHFYGNIRLDHFHINHDHLLLIMHIIIIYIHKVILYHFYIILYFIHLLKNNKNILILKKIIYYLYFYDHIHLSLLIMFYKTHLNNFITNMVKIIHLILIVHYNKLYKIILKFLQPIF